MPLHWIIDSRAELVTTVAEGKIVRADVDAYIDAVVGAGALGYRKLYDGVGATVEMQAEELLELGVRFRSYHGQRVGAVALVLTQEQRQELSRLLGVLASADRPLRLFKTRATAKRWLDSLGAGGG